MSGTAGVGTPRAPAPVVVTDTEPEIDGEYEVDVTPEAPAAKKAATAAAKKEAKPAPAPKKRAQPVQEDLSKNAPQPRVAGRFAAKEAEREKSMAEVTAANLAGVRDHVRKMLAPQTDDDALDSVKPTGKDPAAKKDSGQGDKPTRATAKAPSEPEEEPADAPSEEDLEKARTALRLRKMDDEDLALLTPEQTIALGNKATKLTADEQREKREAAEKRKPAEPGKKPAPTAKASASDDADEDAEFDALAKQHFAQFEDDSGFTTSLAKHSKAVSARLRTALEKHVSDKIESMQTEMSKTVTDAMNAQRGAYLLDRAVDKIAKDYPLVETPEGRKKLEAAVAGLAGTGLHKDVPSLVRAAADGLWPGAEQRAHESKRQDKIRAANGAGEAIVSGTGTPPKKLSDYEIARQVVHEKMRG